MRRIVLLIAAGVAGLLALAALVLGSVAGWAAGTQRDDDGFFTTSTEEFATESRALVSEEIDWFSDQGPRAVRDLLTVRFTFEGAGEGAVFVGIADADELESYLEGVASSRVTDVDYDPFDLTTEESDGGAPATPPGDQTFWAAQAVGTGEQVLEWDVEAGTWEVVLMNADGSAGVRADVEIGARVDAIVPIAIGLIVGGLLLGGLAALFVALAVGTAEPEHELTAATPERNPVRLDAELDSPSQGLWLVKWLLALPHVAVLIALWIAFALLTVVAGVAILFTGRYPTRIFRFNLGVIRWTWRVVYYAYGALGTDRYPPFSLGAEPDYPARITIDEPGQLSRGLVLVKWWLLILPHYLLIAAIGGGFVFGPGPDEAIGLVPLLVVFAGVSLLFRRVYPQGIFDLVVGLQRWGYRVLAYAALMTDEYPPFRLDLGGTEPDDRPTGPPVPPLAGGRVEEAELAGV